MVHVMSLGLQEPHDQARLGRPKTVDSEAMLQAIEANPANNKEY